MNEWLKKAQASLEEASGSLRSAKESVASVAAKGYEGAVGALRCVVSEGRRIDEEGTPLRAAIRAARVAANGAISEGYWTYDAARSASAEQLETVAQRTTFLREAAATLDETRHNKPELLVGGLTLAAFGLSLLGSRKRLLFNGVSALALSSSAVYGSLWWQARHAPPPPPSEKDD